MDYLRALMGLFLIVVAASNLWLALSKGNLEQNPVSGWFVHHLGGTNARRLLIGVAIAIGLLGVLTVILAIAPPDDLRR